MNIEGTNMPETGEEQAHTHEKRIAPSRSEQLPQLEDEMLSTAVDAEGFARHFER